jgi:tellurite resistance protein
MNIESPSKAVLERAGTPQGSALADAIAAAFALVAVADARLEHLEVSRFLTVVRAEPRLAGAPWDKIEGRFNECSAAVMAQGEKAEQQALDLVAAVKSSADDAAAVIGAARIALVANRAVKAPEEAALAKVAAALGVDPESV